jgi:ABC-type multidrug transport system ATPase subunit
VQTPSRGIEVEQLRRSFGDVHAVTGVTFVAEPGVITALVGPNGSGKTTLLLMLASLLRPDAGTIRIDGLDPVTDSAAVRARLGWMPDQFGSWAALTVRVTLEITGRLHGMTRRDAASRAAALIDLLGLDELADRPSRVLSRGQKQRLGMARALVNDPSVLLLDEPASGLDPAARVALRDLLRRLAEEGRSILVSSHALDELEQMADTAVYLRGGATVPIEDVERARESEHTWRVRALDMDLLDEALRQRNGIDADARGRLVPVADEREAAALLAELIGAGVRVTDFAPVRGDLEHTFIELAKGTR